MMNAEGGKKRIGKSMLGRIRSKRDPRPRGTRPYSSLRLHHSIAIRLLIVRIIFKA